METRIVYIAAPPGRGADHQAMREKLDALVQAISDERLLEEILACHQNYSADEVTSWLRYTKLQASPIKDVLSTSMVTVTISTHTREILRVVARAHQRLMLRQSHLNDIDLSIST